MKSSILIFILALCSCTTGPGFSSKSVRYEKIRRFQVGVTLDTEVKRVLGSPDGTVKENEYNVLSYDDRETGSQRLSMEFNQQDGKLVTILWIPLAVEKEFSLANAKASFENVKFQETIEKENNPHVVSKGVAFYIDEKAGVTIRYNMDQENVEAIAIYDVNARVPAGGLFKSNVPYTFGDSGSSH